MLLLWWYSHVLYTLYVIFMHFPALTYWQDAEEPVVVFCCFWFQKSYKGNILGIGRNQRPGSYFSTKLPEDRKDYEVGRRGAATPGPRGQGWGLAALLCGALASPPDLPFRLLKAFIANTPVPRATIRKTFQRRRRRQSHLGGFRRSPPAPCRRGESSPGGLFTATVASGVMSE